MSEPWTTPVENAAFQWICHGVMTLDMPGVSVRELSVHTRIFEDLGLDSLKMVDLTVWIEEVSGLDAFPMQEWLDRYARGGRAPTLGDLADAVQAALAARAAQGARLVAG